MTGSLDHLNKLFENRVRLGLMSALVVNDALDFNSLKELLGTSDGNLASHASALEAEGYLKVKKTFRGRKPRTTYSATAAGKKAFGDHVNALARLLNISK
jgi:DNA-binding HxlR family transcriptional regulator